MTASTTRSFGLSLLLHFTGVVLICFAFASVRTEITLPTSEVFTIVPVSDPILSGAQHQTGTNPVRVSVPKPAPTKFTPAKEQAEPVPFPHAQALPAPRSRISINDFRSQHPATRSSHQSGARPLPRVSEHISFGPQGGPSMASEGPDELSFVPSLLSDLRSALDSAGIDQTGLQATIDFTLGSDGALVNTRISRSSGSREFDAAVLAATTLVRAKAFARAAAGKRYTVAFRTRDE